MSDKTKTPVSTFDVSVTNQSHMSYHQRTTKTQQTSNSAAEQNAALLIEPSSTHHATEPQTRSHPLRHGKLKVITIIDGVLACGSKTRFACPHTASSSAIILTMNITSEIFVPFCRGLPLPLLCLLPNHVGSGGRVSSDRSVNHFVLENLVHCWSISQVELQNSCQEFAVCVGYHSGPPSLERLCWGIFGHGADQAERVHIDYNVNSVWKGVESVVHLL